MTTKPTNDSAVPLFMVFNEATGAQLWEGHSLKTAQEFLRTLPPDIDSYSIHKKIRVGIKIVAPKAGNIVQLGPSLSTRAKRAKK